MKPSTTIVAALAALVTLPAAAEAPADPNAQQAKALIQEFATTLQSELKAGMQEGGPTTAIAICQDRAPAIAADLAERSGWEVGRTSLKTRNAAANAPDAWETQVLTEFDARRAAGESVETMAYAEVVETEGGTTYRFMKAIPTAEVCLACHGTDLTPEVAAALDERYPDDAARGYALGDVRGAFSLAKPL
jgi:hypothetical protein